jgi:transcriptional regulator with XRE-family HTH domain
MDVDRSDGLDQTDADSLRSGTRRGKRFALINTLYRSTHSAYHQIERNPGSAEADGSIDPRDVLLALKRYLSESEDDRREIANKIGVSWTTLSAWLAGEAEPHKRILARVAGFLRRFGYL